MLEVKLNKSNDNPFYGLKNCLQLYQNASKGVITDVALNQCWNEVKNDKVKREMFFCLLFSIGDITARQHNIFKGNKVDSGGNSQRDAFKVIVQWIANNNLVQFDKFLFAGLFNEFSGFDALFANRIQTKKKTQQITKMYSSFFGSQAYLEVLAQYVVSIIKGNNPTNKYFVAKFLTRPRVSKRKGHKKMLPATKKSMRKKECFLRMVSKGANLPYIRKKTHIEFTGYYNWRKDYIGSLESVLFSSKKILEFDKQEFLKWLEGLPAGARFRVRTRLLTKDNKLKIEAKTGSEQGVKWINLGQWFLEWEKFKDQKQTEVRVLEEKVRQGDTSDDTKVKLAKTKKEAKVTTGAVQFSEMFGDIVRGAVDKLKVQPFLDKINLPYNSLTFIDDSSSMLHANSGYGFTAFDFAAFIATITLMKNPDDTGRSLIGFYSAGCRMFTTMTSTTQNTNRLMRTTVQTIIEPLIKPEQHFLENLQRIRNFSNSIRTGNGTNISSIPDYLYRWVGGDQEKIEQLQQFPVWTVITDGNWNNMGSAEASMNDFMMRCQRYFGYKPFIIAIDVAHNSSAAIERFQGIENMMFIPPNPAQIEQLLTNFKDLDIMDVYTPLQSLHRSNRYDPIKSFVL